MRHICERAATLQAFESRQPIQQQRNENPQEVKIGGCCGGYDPYGDT